MSRYAFRLIGISRSYRGSENRLAAGSGSDKGNGISGKSRKKLSEEGKENWENQRSEKFGFDDWLYEMSMECHTVYSVYYHSWHDKPNISVDMFLNENGKPL